MLKELRKLAYLSMAFVAISFGSHSANAATITYGSAAVPGTCFTSAGANDCVTTTGHISASVVGTLSVNEVKAMNFGNMTDCGGACAGGTTIVLNPATGARTLTGSDVTLMNGVDANDGLGGTPGNALNGSQGPGIFNITDAGEFAAGQVYVSFATVDGLPLDYSGEDLYPTNHVDLYGPGDTASGGTLLGFTVDDFTINCTAAGSDVYGHYCDGGNATLQLKVGATLHTTTANITPGKYTGVYAVMVSY